MADSFSGFVHDHVAELQPLEKSAALAWWEAATTGRDVAYRQGAELQTRIENLLADRDPRPRFVRPEPCSPARR